MAERDWHELYLRGLMTQLDLDRYESLVTAHADLADELAARLADDQGWDPGMALRARAMLAVRTTYPAYTELLSSVPDAPLTDELFAWPVEESARTLNDRSAVRLVNAVVIRAIEHGLGAVRIAACEEGVAIEAAFSPTGTLLTTPRGLLKPVMARLKRVARLDPECCGVEQTGLLPLRWAGVDYEVKVHIRPDAGEEAAVLSFRRVDD